jgi:hypothetical protein
VMIAPEVRTAKNLRQTGLLATDVEFKPVFLVSSLGTQHFRVHISALRW